MESGSNNNKPVPPSSMLERRTRPQKDQALNCPRCNSTNTKFCYYNNYSLSQPRYFCKTCRRYWTEGGSLRNVPVGGGSRKNKRSTPSTSSTSSLIKNTTKLDFPQQSASQNPKIHQGQDLNLAYPSSAEDYNKIMEIPTNSSSAMELLKSGIATTTTCSTSRGLNLTSFMPVSLADSSTMYSSSGFPSLQEFKGGLNFSLEGFENGFGGIQDGNGARMLFPVEDLKHQVPNSAEFEQGRNTQGDSTGYWNGMLGGGSW